MACGNCDFLHPPFRKRENTGFPPEAGRPAFAGMTRRGKGDFGLGGYSLFLGDKLQPVYIFSFCRSLKGDFGFGGYTVNCGAIMHARTQRRED